MVVIFFLFALFAGDVEVGAVEGDDVVAAVGAGVVDGFVFAHEDEGDLGGETAQGARVAGEVDEVPGAGVG